MIGPHTIDDWLAMDPPVDGSRLELIFGHRHVTDPPSGEHQSAAFHLAIHLDDALHAGGRNDLYVVPAVNVKVSGAWRTALIPDVVVLTRKPTDVSFAASDLALVAEVWSPGNPCAERETKLAAYADAGIPFVWTIDLHDLTLTAYRLQDDQYVIENKIQGNSAATVTAAPVPITLNLADLLA